MTDVLDPEVSGLKFYSLGRAANNKPRHEKMLEVTPIEQMSMLDGELVSLPFDSQVTGQNIDGTEYASRVILDTAITAAWLPFGTNMATAPDVRRGERVFIYRYRDTDQYYWVIAGWDDHLRRKETKHIRISATDDESADMSDPKNYYHLVLSSHDQMIELQTSKVSGESARYCLQFNLKEGVVALADDFGNFTQLESTENTWSTQNGDGTLFQLVKKDIYAYAPETFRIIAEKMVHIKTKQLLIECETGKIEASSNFDIETPSFNVKSTTNTFETPNTTFTGNVTVGGSFTGASNGGPSTFVGPVTFQQQIQANGIRSSRPIVGPSNTI